MVDELKVLRAPKEFSSAAGRIRRALEHLEEFERIACTFRSAGPYVRVVEQNPERGSEVHKLVLSKPLPEKLGDLAADAADCLRQSLDQACWAAAYAEQGEQVGRNTHFPFGTSAADLDRALHSGSSKDIPAQIKPVIRRFESHKEGNLPLWGLNRLRVTNQHRLIHPVDQAAITSTRVTNYHCKATTFFMALPPKWDWEKDEAIICEVTAGSNPEYEIYMPLAIGFGDIDVFSRQPVVPVLRDLSASVEYIVSRIVAESIRSGLVKN